jgi:hypothetical protein
MEKNCLHCGGVFIEARHQANRQLYCSKKCANRHRHKSSEFLSKDRKWREENHEHIRKYMREWRTKNQEKIKEYAAKHRPKSRERNLKRYYENHEINKVRAKAERKIRLYGVTPGKYQEMLDAQNGECAICRKPQRDDRPLCIDHCHRSGKVRGLLCDRCNTRLAAIEDESYHRKALAYLNDHADGYSVQWKSFHAQFVSENPICENARTQ